MKKCVLLILSVFISINIFSQDKIPLGHTDYARWKTIGSKMISAGGRYIVYEVNPLKGDGFLVISDMNTGRNDTVFRGYNAAFLPGDAYVVAMVKPQDELVSHLKREKKKNDELPADSLVIYSLKDKSRILYADVESYQVAKEETGWLAVKKKYIPPVKSDSLSEEGTEELNEAEGTGKAAPDKTKDGSGLEKEFNKLAKKNKAGDLIIINPALSVSSVYENVVKYNVSRNGKLTGFIQIKRDSLPGYVAYAWIAGEQQLLITGDGDGLPARMCVDDNGLQFSYAVTSDTVAGSGLELYYWTPGFETAGLLTENGAEGLKPGWGVSENGPLFFSGDGSELYFGTAPVLPVPEKDTLLKEEKFSLDVWNWKDPLLQPEQLKHLEKDKKQTWLAVISPAGGKVVQLADSTVDNIRLLHRNNGRLLLGTDNDKYARLVNWEGYLYCDAYLVDNETGYRKLIAEKLTDNLSLSEFGKYVLWYQIFDSAWYVYDIQKGITRNVTKSIGFPFYDEDNDMPSEAGPYGMAGWTNDDSFLLLYDRYDIWKIDPSGKLPPECLTKGQGREDHVRYRYQRTDPEEWFIDLDKPVYLTAFNTDDMTSGFSVVTPGSKGSLTELVYGPWRYSGLTKAADTDKFIWQKQDFRHFPDLWFSGIKFSKGTRISDVNPQQKDYLWGNVQLVNWVSCAGDSLKGLLYTPDNLDPEGSYPMLVYYYEKNSEGLYRFSVPSPSRSIINPSWCVSNGYVVFVPDIVYRDGYPGQSAYDAVVCGTEAMLEQFPFIDKNRMGLQGQSWGGYQTAYLVTRTNMFAAAMAGAPVSNMTSAYGGIRWGTGLSRMFQYEHSQSRIGGTLWEKRDLYLENSPLFYAPDVSTPLLIMHNDNDGAVPWYQGIEFFTALRRLDKPVWMLVYNGEEHNLTRWPNRIDLSIRMMQFFDHYLKGAPEPEWMSNGIPAVKKGETSGYEFEEKN